MAVHGRIYLVEGINPVPWTAPQSSGYGKSQVFYKSEELRAYQEALAEEFLVQNPDPSYHKSGTALAIEFDFWRRLDTYELDDERKSSLHRADATNLQKSTEDALQGVLFDNDRDVHFVRSRIVSQSEATEPAVLMHVTEYNDTHVSADSVRRDILAHRQVQEGLASTSPSTAQRSRTQKWDVDKTF